jgi:hypothetical protein
MSSKVQDVLEEARQLPPHEQLVLLRALSESLQSQYPEVASQLQSGKLDKIPSSVVRTKPVVDLDEYVADFWPEDESIDELKSYIHDQRAADRLSDQ